MKAFITIDNLVKKYGKKIVLQNISFQIEAGKIYGFIGPNGAGKTTTLKCILGLTNFESGEIKLNGVPISYEKGLKKIGYLQDVPEFFQQMTGLEYLKLFSNMPQDMSDTFITEFQLEEFIFNPIKTYSLGMKKKLGLALAFLSNPECVFMDEPFTGLDPFMMVEIREMLEKMKSNKYTIFLSSHVLSELEQICDHFIMIHNGRIILDKSSQDLFQEYVKIPVEQICESTIKTNQYFQYKKFIFLKKEQAYSIFNSRDYQIFQRPILEELFMIHAKNAESFPQR